MNDRSVLHLGCRSGKSKIVRFLVEQKADVNVLDDKEMTPIFEACLQGNLDMVSLLIFEGADLEHKDDEGSTPLLHTIHTGNISMVAFFIDSGAKVNVSKDDGTTPLMEASQYGYSMIVALLLRCGAEIETCDQNERTGLFYASGNITTLLLAHGANIDHKKTDGYTSFMVACGWGDNVTVSILLDRGQEVDQTDDMGNTVLMHTVKYRHRDTVQLLLEQNASVMIRNKNSQNVLMMTDDIQIIEMLLAYGADTEATDCMGYSVIVHSTILNDRKAYMYWRTMGYSITANLKDRMSSAQEQISPQIIEEVDTEIKGDKDLVLSPALRETLLAEIGINDLATMVMDYVADTTPLTNLFDWRDFHDQDFFDEYDEYDDRDDCYQSTGGIGPCPCCGSIYDNGEDY